MVASDEAPLGFAGDVSGNASYKIAGGGFAQLHAARVEHPPPPSLQDRNLLGGGVVIPGVEAAPGSRAGGGSSVITWRAQEGALWLEERGLDEDLDGGRLQLILPGK